MSYPQERKAAILKKLLPPNNMTVTQVAREDGILAQTLYSCRNKAKQSGLPVPGKLDAFWEGSGRSTPALLTPRTF